MKCDFADRINKHTPLLFYERWNSAAWSSCNILIPTQQIQYL